MGMNDNPLDVLRTRKVVKPVVRDRQDRVDATMAPDARKARDIVKAVARSDEPLNVTLVDVALDIAKITADQAVRVGLEDRAEAFVKATQIYQQEELQPPRPLTWMGDRAGRFPGDGPPPGLPEHHILLMGSWLALLTAVNEATKVGVQKVSKYQPITLTADIDAAPLTGGSTSWV